MLWLLIGYLFLFIHRPFEVWPILGTIRLELLYMLFAGSIWLVYPSKRLALDPLTLAVAGLAAAVVLCTFLSPWTSQCLLATEAWLKLLVFFLMLITVVQTEADLRRLVLAFLVVMSGYMAHSLWEFMGGRYVSRMGISRLLGIDSTSDPNSFGMSMVLSLVFVPVLWRTAASRPLRQFLAGYVSLAMLCICLTGSRGAFVALLIWAGVVVWRSAYRGRLLALLLPTAPLLFLLLPASLQNRFETIINPDAGPKNARTSADGRIDGFFVGMQLWRDNPVAGVGPGAWIPATGRKLLSHNLYGQVAGEMGTLGVAAMTALVGAFLGGIRAVRRCCHPFADAPPDFLYLLAGAIGVALLLLLLGGLIGHNLFRPHWILYAAFLIIARRCAAERAAASAWDWYAAPDPDEETPAVWGQQPA